MSTKVKRTEERDVLLKLNDSMFARFRHSGGVSLCAGRGSTFIPPDEVKAFKELVLALAEELEPLTKEIDMETIHYQVEYKKLSGDQEWLTTGPRLKDYSEALARLMEANKDHPEYTHRVIQTSVGVVSVVAGEHEIRG